MESEAQKKFSPGNGDSDDFVHGKFGLDFLAPGMRSQSQRRTFRGKDKETDGCN